VLIVDDDPGFLALASRILRGMGIEAVATAADAAQALRAVQDMRPDAALVDMGLPDRDGIELAHELSKMPWKPRVVLTSSDGDAFLAIEALEQQRRLPFIPKAELASANLREMLADR
jgi:CheY-like chemotaxis protein